MRMCRWRGACIKGLLFRTGCLDECWVDVVRPLVWVGKKHKGEDWRKMDICMMDVLVYTLMNFLFLSFLFVLDNFFVLEKCFVLKDVLIVRKGQAVKSHHNYSVPLISLDRSPILKIRQTIGLHDMSVVEGPRGRFGVYSLRF